MTASERARHAIVIGAGVGGLTAAIDLATRGYRVSLFETHASPGGKIHQVSIDGLGMDAGPTVFTLRAVFDELYARAGARFDEEVGLTEGGILARHSWIDSESLDLYADVDRSCDAISVFAGAREADNYRRFAARTAEVFDTLDDTFMRAPLPNPLSLAIAAAPKGLKRLLQTAPYTTLWRSLNRQFSDPRLRQLFGRYATYCGSSPFDAPATLALIAHAERAGVWTLTGGMQALATSLAELAAKLGCECHYGAHVASIQMRDGRASGVVLADDRLIEADAIVFNGDVQALQSGLLGSHVKRATVARPAAALSAVTRCQKADVRGFDLSHHTVFFNDDYQAEFDALFKRQILPEEPTLYVCAQDRSASAEPTDSIAVGPERIFCLANAPARPLDDSEVAQAQLAMTRMLQRHGLELTEQTPAVITQPADFEQRFPASNGALYGRPTHGPLGSFRRPGTRSKVPGLYLAGGTVHPGAGVPMAATSGTLAAACIHQDAN
jgi:1-hydroxycarotenoid 3,4-desaturase